MCAVPEDYNLDWVKEFYTMVETYNRVNITVRHTPVSYASHEWNELFELVPPENSELDRLMSGATNEDLDIILDKIAYEGAYWTFKWKTRLLRTNTLKPEASVWSYFLRHTLHPTMHDTDLCMERVFMLFCILESKPFNV